MAAACAAPPAPTRSPSGAGPALPALTDTVMAAVSVDDAGIGSAVNDMSRELGAALGIAITGRP